MPADTVKTFLDEHGVKYVVIQHSPAYTAQEVAESAHISGKNIAKTVIVKLDGDLAMAVLPANREINFDMLREYAWVGSAELAAEEEFADRFPNCEVGAMPPFGNLYGMEVYMEEQLAEDDEFAFEAGTHHELIGMKSEDYQRLVEPKVISFAFQA